MDNEEKKVQDKVNKSKVKGTPKKNKKDWQCMRVKFFLILALPFVGKKIQKANQYSYLRILDA